MDINYNKLQELRNKDNTYLISKLADYFDAIILSHLSQDDLLEAIRNGKPTYFVRLFDEVDFTNNYSTNLELTYNTPFLIIFRFILHIFYYMTCGYLDKNFAKFFYDKISPRLINQDKYQFSKIIFNKKKLSLYDPTLETTIHEEIMATIEPKNIYLKALDLFLKRHNYKYKNFPIQKASSVYKDIDKQITIYYGINIILQN